LVPGACVPEALPKNGAHVLSMERITRVFRMGEAEIRAVDGVDLQVDKGDFLAVMGPSGSGKSTLMNLLGCLDTPTSGTYRIGNREVGRLDDDALAEIRNTHIGFVFQTFNLLARLDARQNVELPLVYARVPLEKRAGRTSAMLRRVGLEDRSRHRPDQLSGGQRQRVAIARALVHEPAILLADEPTGNLDSVTSGEIMEIFVRLNREGHTIVMVTHDEEVAAHANRVIRMHDGVIREESRRGR
jgi:putative ABC transport system ATP-binding protein